MWWRAETTFRRSTKRTSPFKSAGASVQSTTGSWGVRIRGRNAGYTMFRGSVESTGHPLHSPDSPSLPFLCVTVCYHISAGLYNFTCTYWRNNDTSAHKGLLGTWRCWYTHFLMDTSGQVHHPAALPPGKNLRYPLNRRLEALTVRIYLGG